MDNLSKFVLDISSDEEVGFGNLIKEGDGCSAADASGGEVYDKDDHEWLQTLLGEVDGKKGDDGLGLLGDDGLGPLGDGMSSVKDVAQETIENLSVQSPKPVFEVVKPAPEIVNIDSDSDESGDDDDCVVLDGDPDKPVLVEKAEGNCGGGNDSDDVEIVAEKGEVACRDFPHSRHLCAKFIFASTSHVDHCGQCHCYVCDTLAPCVHWGTGTSSIDHCHASDKEDYWITERKRIKKGDKPAPVTIKSFFSRNHQTTPVAPPPPSSLVPRQVGMPVTTPPCSVSSDVSAIDRFRLLRRSQSMSARMRTTCNSHVSSMDMNQNVAKRGYPFSPPQGDLYNVNVFDGASPHTMHGFNFNNSSSQPQSLHEPSLKRCRTLPTGVPNGSYGSNQYNGGSCVPMSTHMNSSAPPTMNVGSTYIPSQPQIPSGASHPIKPSQPQTCPCPAPISSHPISSFQPQIRPGPPVFRPIRPTPTRSISSSQIRPNAQIRPGPISSNQRPSQPQIRPGPISSNQRPSQPQICPSPISSNQRPSQPQIRPGSITNGMVRSSQAQIQPGPISSSPIRATTNPRIPSQSQPYPGSNFVNSATAQSQATSQSGAAGFMNVIGSQTGSTFQPNCSLPSQTFGSTLPNLSSTPGSQPHPKSTTSSYPGISNTSQNQSSSHYSSSAIDGQTACQQMTEGNLFTSQVLEREWEAFLNQNGSEAPTDTPLLRSVAPADNNPSLSAQKDDHVQNLSSADNFLENSVLSPPDYSSLSLPECFKFDRSVYDNPLSDLVVPESPLWGEFSH